MQTPSSRTTLDTDHEVVEGRTIGATMPLWSPAQIIALVAGIGSVVLGVVALARTGFDTNHVYTPHALVWHLPHSPLLGAVEVAFGALLVLAGVAPAGMRGLMAFLGAVSLAFGVVVLVEDTPNRLNHWLAVTHRSGWLFTVVGTVVLLERAALADLRWRTAPPGGATPRARRLTRPTGSAPGSVGDADRPEVAREATVHQVRVRHREVAGEPPHRTP